ncbi:MAG: dihydrofolate reductase family protein, partial [Xanthobacteraceae bacterium]
LKLLAAKGITRLMVEGGPTLAAAFLAADLVDEAILFHSAKPVGPDGIDALDASAMTALQRRLQHINSEEIGPDRQETFERN